MSRARTLEVRLGRLLGVGVTISTILLGVGLVWHMGHGADMKMESLAAGLFILMATPILRVLVATMTFIRERDWLFAVFAGAVFAVLIISIVIALQ